MWAAVLGYRPHSGPVGLGPTQPMGPYGSWSTEWPSERGPVSSRRRSLAWQCGRGGQGAERPADVSVAAQWLRRQARGLVPTKAAPPCRAGPLQQRGRRKLCSPRLPREPLSLEGPHDMPASKRRRCLLPPQYPPILGPPPRASCCSLCQQGLTAQAGPGSAAGGLGHGLA